MDHLGIFLAGAAAIVFPIWWGWALYRAIKRALNDPEAAHQPSCIPLPALFIPIAYFLHLIEPGATYAVLAASEKSRNIRRRRQRRHIAAFLKLAKDLRMRSNCRKNALPRLPASHGGSGKGGISGPVA